MLNAYQSGYLREVNPWWRGESSSESRSWVEREESEWVRTSVESGARLLYLTGARRVGKSTVLHQAAHKLLGGYAVLYASAEDLLAYGAPVGLIDELLTFLRSEVLLESVQRRRVVLLLDEIHHLPQWQQQVKRFYDTRKNVHFVLTSSQSPRAQRGKESLAGRVVQKELLPFSFAESLLLEGGSCPPELFEARRCFQGFFIKQDVGELRIGLTDCFRALSPHWNELAAQFSLYLRRGGFPEWVQRVDAAVARDYFRDAIVSKVVNEDIPAGFGVTDRALLQRLFHVGLSRSGNELNMSKIASDLAVNKSTVNSYLHYLAETHLIHLVPRHAASLAGQARSFSKVFALDPGLFWSFESLARHSETELIGPAAEIAVHTTLRRLAGSEASLTYFRDTRSRECDFLLELSPGHHVPIEVKTAHRVPEATDRLLNELAAELRAPLAVGLSSGQFDFTGKIAHLPLLMLCA